MLYDTLKICVSVFFNILNKLMGGKLPPFGTASVIVEQGGRYLVVELPRGRVVFPGGFMAWKEQPPQAAEREGREETGLQLHALDLIGAYSEVSDSFTHMSNVGFVYRAEVVGGTLRKNIEGQPCWLDERELRQRMNSGSLRVLDDYLRKQDSGAQFM
jgi:ADP-ribose pyrophosphatase YjhB (NUDIX family)